MCDHLINALITFVATGLGVYGAFFVDNYRDKTAKRDLKNRLIRGLSTEVNRLEKFLIDRYRSDPNFRKIVLTRNAKWRKTKKR